MKKYIFYKIEKDNQCGQYHITDIAGIFKLLGNNGTTLPKSIIGGSEVNQPEIEQIMERQELLRIVYNGDDWIITKL